MKRLFAGLVQAYFATDMNRLVKNYFEYLWPDSLPTNVNMDKRDRA
ncbi:MAG: hypothetical protein ABSF63_15645 [Candidatus Bathyarchaeia archaeon]|jgi:hypothetical protein